jgi:hypothetical protein
MWRLFKKIIIGVLEQSELISFFNREFGLILCSVLLAWTLSNALLAAVITATNDLSTANKAVNGYMVFLLYSVAGLARELFAFSFFLKWLD